MEASDGRRLVTWAEGTGRRGSRKEASDGRKLVT